MTPPSGEHTAGFLGGRRRIAAAATVLTGEVSRLLRLGNGSVIGGRVGLAIDPGLVGGLSVGKRCALVSGTNGKTTTTRLLVAALGGPERVASSSAGANLPAGLASALASSASKGLAVLEVDEAYLGGVAAATSPEVIALLNLSRDQLDRVNEVRMLAQRWRDAMSALSTPKGSSVTVVANADDPLVVWAAQPDRHVPQQGQSPRVLFVAAGQLWHEDSTGCPACGGRITFDPSGGWSCECGFKRPELYASLTPAGLELADGRAIPISLSIPARCNRANAAIAAVAASVLGTDVADALAAMSSVQEVEGRFSTVRVDGITTRLLLAKTPAGWAELLDLFDGSDVPIVVGINSRIADGHDPSWLWDVPFEQLAGRLVVATGERCRDLGVRLKYAGLEHKIARGQRTALAIAEAPAVEYVGNYTAFQQLRASISGRARATRTESRVEVPAAIENGATFQARAVPIIGAQGRESALRIVVVHPDLLGTYGDGGNGRVLACRAAWRGWPVELILARSDSPLPVADIYCLGGGEDAPQVEAAELLAESVLVDAVSKGAVVLAVCAGFQIVGQSFPDADGQNHQGLGLLDVVTVKNTGKRMVGEVVSDPAKPSLGSLDLEPFTGFENHSGLTQLGAGAVPLGIVRSGTGNGAGEGTEGAVEGNVVGTYLHGPVLARNPTLADALLSLATKQVPDALDDSEELALRKERFAAAAPGSGRSWSGRDVISRLVRARRT
jgi:CobQ-like glutamine amidotransferase family enzyme/UDP-N-acetylmuramyl tripeptide synthase